MYLLLPLEDSNDSSHLSCRINWTGITSCISLVELLKNNSLLGSEQCNHNGGNLLPANMVSFANSSIHVANLRDTVVLAIHTGRFYSVVEAVSNSSAESSFDGNIDAAPVQYVTFNEYFHKK